MVRYSERQIMCYNGPSWLTLRSAHYAASSNPLMGLVDIHECVLAATPVVENVLLVCGEKMMWVVKRIYNAVMVLVSKSTSAFSDGKTVSVRSVGSRRRRVTTMAGFVGWLLIMIRKRVKCAGCSVISATVAWGSLIQSGGQKPCAIGNGGRDD